MRSGCLGECRSGAHAMAIIYIPVSMQLMRLPRNDMEMESMNCNTIAEAKATWPIFIYLPTD